ncbi:CBS domain-containing protein [Thiocapsa bogorovii]|jgi:predicted transcriptional regulator|uniref:CBS domain-containing protein n=1 Tax=Thiocapsa bogorovii TaxID=521689 RepID=UPI001E408C9A|nr:CBS domain-containing protein [Thiocapsa bogorovii]UHD15647.1 CBS domain-containing protein [Thiocapsa bogorovii]
MPNKTPAARTLYHKRMEDLTNAVTSRPKLDVRKLFQTQLLDVPISQVFQPNRQSRVIAVDDGRSVGDAVDTMVGQRVATVFVSDPKRNVIAMITPSQCMTAIGQQAGSDPVTKWATKISQCECIDAKDTVRDALSKFSRTGYRRLVVIQGKNSIEGVLTVGGLLRWIASAINNIEKTLS